MGACKCCLTPNRSQWLGTICPVCNWEDDDLEGRWEYSSANGSTLNRWRRKWLASVTREERAVYALRCIIAEDSAISTNAAFERCVKQVEFEIETFRKRRG